MGLTDLVPDLDSPDPNVRFKAITALYKLGGAAAPAVPKLVPLLRDIDGVNVKMTDGSERMITIAERTSMALAAIGEPAAGAVCEELKKDNAVSAIHCVRVLATPLLAKRSPVALIGERLMRPKVSLAMSTALCEVLAQILVSGDEASKTVARMSLTAGVAAGKVPQKYQGLVSLAPRAAAPAAAPSPKPAPPPAPIPQPKPAPPPAPTPEPKPAAAAASGGWISADARISEVPAVRPAPPPPRAEPKPAPPPPPPAPKPEPPAFTLEPEPEVLPATRPPSVVASRASIDRPTSMNPSISLPEPEPTPGVEELRGRNVERPAPPHFDPVPTGAPTATFQPEVVFEMQQRVPPFAPRPEPAAVVATYEADDQFQYRQEVGDLLKRGDKLKAVNLLRQKTGASLVEALKQVESWA
ncbi:MAG: hypothetical protein K8T20_10535 [Planctomycetes bacterium]|nr:hypothetical protein [Planctomycetota bacterium]